MIKNSYFKENNRFELNLNYDKLPRLLLIKNNKLTNKTIKTLKEIFNLFSFDGKMSKEQSLQFLHKINKDNNINKLFSYDIDNKGYLLFENFINYYYDLTKDNSNYLWNDLKKLGYNKLLDKNKEYDLEYLKNNLNEFEELNFPLNNFLKIVNMKINKLCLLSEINKIFIDYLNKNKIIADLKILEISIINLKLLIDLNIICPNIKELNLYSIKNNKDENNSKDSNINNIEFNQKEIINIFPEISILKIYFIQNCNLDLIDLIRNLIKIENLEINYKCDFNSKINSKIILNNIKRLKIDCNNEIFMKIFNNINFPNLEYYEIIIKEKMNINEKITVNDKLDEDDYNLINSLLNKNEFLLNDFINCKFKNIKCLKINTGKFLLIIKRDYFEFKLLDENKFKNYYLNYDLSIDNIIKYKKIKIEGLSKLRKNNYNIEIIENKNINNCDINLSLNKNYIKSLKDIRSIYCEEEIQNFISIIQNIINHSELKYLKYINLTIGIVYQILIYLNLLKILKI